MTHEGLFKYLQHMVLAQIPVLVLGLPGVGKSWVMERVADALNMRLITLYASLKNLEDVTGIPIKVADGEMQFVPIGELKLILESTVPTLLFIDELGMASQSVINGLLSLCHRHTRKVSGLWSLPDCVSVVAASNDRTHRAGVQGLTEPAKSRFVFVELTSSNDSFTEFCFSEGLRGEIPAYLRWQPDHLNKFAPTPDFIQSPCERGWHSVSDQMEFLPMDYWLESFVGTIGQEVATGFVGFCQIYLALPDYDAIVADPESAVLPTDTAARFALCGMLANNVSTADSAAVFTYAGRMDAEYQVAFVKLAVTRDADLMKTPAFTVWALDNADVIL